jgi:tetratricopeptide (TPR) repeat protein
MFGAGSSYEKLKLRFTEAFMRSDFVNNFVKRYKLLLFILSIVVISFILHISSVYVETAENIINSEDKLTVDSLDSSKKEDLAKHIFFEIRFVDDPAKKAELYKRIADECSGTEFAQEALWRLSQLYLNDFDEPNIKEAINSLERFINSYPKSDWRAHVEFSLIGLYENAKMWKKVIGLCEKVIKENPNMPSKLKEELLRRHKAAKANPQ